MYGSMQRRKGSLCRKNSILSSGSHVSRHPLPGSAGFDHAYYGDRASASSSSSPGRRASRGPRGFWMAASTQSVQEEVRLVLDLIQELLAAHEVKMSMELLGALSKSGLADCSFSIANTTLYDELRVFVQRVKDKTISDSRSNLLTVEQLIEQLPRQEPRRRPDEDEDATEDAQDLYSSNLDKVGSSEDAVSSRDEKVASESDVFSFRDLSDVADEGQELSVLPCHSPVQDASVKSMSPTAEELQDLPDLATAPPRPVRDGAGAAGEMPREPSSGGLLSAWAATALVETSLSSKRRSSQRRSSNHTASSQDSERIAARRTMSNRSLDSNSDSIYDDVQFESEGEAHKVQTIIDFDDLSMEQMVFLATPSDSWVLHPDSTYRLSWDALTLFLILFECITLPLSLCFDLQLPNAVHITSTIVFCVDIVLQFNTGYNRGSALIMRRSWLTRHYIRTWFLIDIIATFPWEELFSEIQSDSQDTSMFRIAHVGKLARVMRLLRLAKIMVLLKRLQHGQYFFVRGTAYQLRLAVVVTKMLVVFGFLAHWFACIWGAIGNSYSAGIHDLDVCAMGAPCEHGLIGSAWIHRYGLNRYDTWTIYSVALQFTTSVLTGGSTPLQPGSPGEMLFTVCVMICSLLVTSSVVGQILLIMNRHAEQSMAFDDMMQQAREFMVDRKVPTNLQMRVQRYLETQNKAALGNGINERYWIHQLSGWLQTELNIALTQVHIFSHPFFQELEGIPDMLRRICLDATNAVYAAGDVLVEEGRAADCVHFLVRGKIRIVKGDICKYEVPPCWIGDVCLFTDTVRSATVSCVVSSETIIVHKCRFSTLCEENGRVAELRDFWRDKLEQEGLTLFRCPTCGAVGHAEKDCPKLILMQSKSQESLEVRKSLRHSISSYARGILSRLTSAQTLAGDDIDGDTMTVKATTSIRSNQSRTLSFKPSVGKSLSNASSSRRTPSGWNKSQQFLK